MSVPFKANTKSLSVPRVPGEAMKLLLDPRRLRWACDFARNPAFHGADARTMDLDDKTMADVVSGTHPEEWVGRLQEFFRQATEVIAGAMPALKFTTTSKRGDPSDEDAGWDQLDEDDGVLLTETDPTPRPDNPRNGRAICIPSAWSRMIGNAVAAVLEDTADPMFLNESIAYRKRNPIVIRRVLYEIAGLMERGWWFHAKLDITAFFDRILRQDLEEVLRGHGYPPEFVAMVMAHVRSKLFTRRRGRWVEEIRDRGVPQGLPEAPVLANLYLHALDLALKAKFGKRIRFKRYSDDILILARGRRAVTEAVSFIRGWLDKRGMSLKDTTAPNGKQMSAESLVHDARTRPLVFLGVEVQLKGPTQHPRAHLAIPKRIKEAFARRIAHRMRFMPVRDQALGVAGSSNLTIIGDSKYSAGAGPKGRHRYDLHDLWESIDTFRDYWTPIAGKPAVDAFVRELVDTQDVPSPSSGLEHTWVAVMARPGALPAPGVDLRGRRRQGMDREAVRAVWLDDPYAGAPPPADTTSSFREEWLDSLEMMGQLEELPEGGTHPGDHGAKEVGVEHDSQIPEEKEGDEPSDSEGQFEEAEGGLVHDPREEDRDGDSVEGPVVSVHSYTSDYDCYRSFGSVSPVIGYDRAAPGGSTTPPSGGSQERRDVYLVARECRKAGGTALAWWRWDGGMAATPAPASFGIDGRVDHAVYSFLLAELHRASEDGKTVLVVRMDTPRFAQALVQDGRRYRHPLLFNTIRKVHAVAQRAGLLLLLGGWIDLPPSVTSEAVRLAEDMRARADERRHRRRSGALSAPVSCASGRCF